MPTTRVPDCHAAARNTRPCLGLHRTQIIRRFAREVDPEGRRSIGVITKPDMIPEAQHLSHEKIIKLAGSSCGKSFKFMSSCTTTTTSTVPGLGGARSCGAGATTAIGTTTNLNGSNTASGSGPAPAPARSTQGTLPFPTISRPSAAATSAPPPSTSTAKALPPTAHKPPAAAAAAETRQLQGLNPGPAGGPRPADALTLGYFVVKNPSQERIQAHISYEQVGAEGVSPRPEGVPCEHSYQKGCLKRSGGARSCEQEGGGTFWMHRHQEQFRAGPHERRGKAGAVCSFY